MRYYSSTHERNFPGIILINTSTKNRRSQDRSGKQSTIAGKIATLVVIVLFCIPFTLEAQTSSATPNHVTCYGGADGSINLTNSGFTSTPTFSWTTSGGSIPSGEETKEDPSGLTAGDYTVLVTSGTETATTLVTINQPEEVNATLTGGSQVNVTCFDGNNGAF